MIDTDKIKAQIMELKIDEEMPLPHSWPYEYLTIDRDLEGKEYMYTWTLKRRGGGGSLYPSKNINYVKYFKTEKGAKRNVLNHLSWLMKDN